MRTELTKYIGNEIKRFRESSSISLEFAANEVDVTPSTWAAWERGDNLTIPRLEQIAAWWEVSVGNFFPEPNVYVPRMTTPEEPDPLDAALDATGGDIDLVEPIESKHAAGWAELRVACDIGPLLRDAALHLEANFPDTSYALSGAADQIAEALAKATATQEQVTDH